MKSENSSLCGTNKKYAALPIIYELIEIAVQKGLASGSYDFISNFIIKNYFEAIEELTLRHGIGLASHGQNLCLVLNPDYTSRGFAYRDMEGISLDPQHKFLESYALFRHHIVTKMANVMVCHEELIPPQKGAPTQVGSRGLLPERALFRYMISQLKCDNAIYKNGVDILLRRYFSVSEYKNIHTLTDALFTAKLRQYYDLEASGILQADGTFPAAESGSENESAMQRGDSSLFKHKKINLPAEKTALVLPKVARGIALLDRPSRISSAFMRGGSLRFSLPNELYKPLSQYVRNKAIAKAEAKQISIKDIHKWHHELMGRNVDEKLASQPYSDRQRLF